MNGSEAGTGSAAVEFSGVGFSWAGEEEALFRDVSLEFARGETCCLIGPNGSGKTTMMELILGWRKAAAGTVLLEGRPIGGVPAGERGRSMSLVPQEERMPFAYTVLDYVLLGRTPHLAPLAVPGPRDVEIAMEVLERVGIASLSGRTVPRLSGGERRLVLIARALVQQPRILLLDEPANHLDPANRERIIGILKMLHESEITLIMSSHEPDLVTRLSQRVVLLKSGKPPVMGDAEDLIRPEELSSLYGIRVRIAEVDRRRIIVWGD